MKRLCSSIFFGLLAGSALSSDVAPLRNLGRKDKDKDDHHNQRPVIINTLPEPEVAPPQKQAFTVTANPEFICPDGFDKTGVDECSRQVVRGAKVGCKFGFIMRGDGLCEAAEQIDPDYVCEPGYAPHGENCYRADVKPFSLDCPPGFAIGQSQCERPITGNPRVACPDGYDIVNGQCYKQIFESPVTMCPEGMQLNAKGQCELQRTVTGSLKCLGKDAHLEGNQCVSLKSFPVDVKCQKGYTMEKNVCVKRTDVATEMVCEEGFEANKDGQCVSEVVEAPELACSKGGYMEVNDKGETLCRIPSLPPSSKKVAYTHTVDEVYPASRVCPKGFMPSGDHCSRVEIRRASHVCPKGSEPYGKSCVEVDQVMPLEICPEGSMYNPNGRVCEVKQTSAPDVVCEPGFTRVSKSEMCAITEVLPSKMGCPQLYEYDMKTNTCYGAETFAPSPVCPGQYQMMDDGLCHGKIVAPAIQACPPKYRETQDGCVYEETIPPMPMCLKGYTLKFDSVCEMTLEEKPGTICPAGFVLQDNRCIRTENARPSPVCPEGFKFDGKQNLCTRTEIRDIQPAQPTQVEPQQIQQAPQQPVVITQVIQAPPPPPRMVYYPQYVVEQQPVVVKEKKEKCDKKKGCNVGSTNIFTMPSNGSTQAYASSSGHKNEYVQPGSTRVIVPQAPASPQYQATGYETTTISGYNPYAYSPYQQY